MTGGTSDALRVRDQVLDDHRRLRTALAALARETTAARREEAGSVLSLGAMLRDLRETFLAHLDYEERELVPFLRVANAWGAVVANRVHEEHKAQRAAVALLVEGATDREKPSIGVLAEQIHRFIHALERDMQHEEATLLTEVALGEEVVVSDQECG
jgi:hypothetical protein